MRRQPGVAAALAGLLAVTLVAGLFVYLAWQARSERNAERRQAALEKAILEAMSGDGLAAEQAIYDAAEKGVAAGQIAMLRRLAGVPIKGENYFKADIAAGRVGSEQPAPRREFD